ncbi:outer membrane protein assembly factor BamA [candidate division KSB1 bacterium]|nr:outer membrane protein assembly factor BamA [candidate division KSB1 bacterium]RQW03369.1 MAG: outer membrane protein assembly factor BamA [candidate division KSB1 bacterium]
MFLDSSSAKPRLCLIILLLTYPLWAQENYRVRKVTFKGNETIASDRLSAEMTLKPKNGLERLRDKGKGVPFSEPLLQADLDELLHFYHQEGFTQADVRVDLQINDKKKTVEIVYHIEEGLPIRVMEIHFSTKSDSFREELTKATDKARSAFKLRQGSRFRDDDFNADLARLKNDLVDIGFVYADIDYGLDIDQKTRSTDIHYAIDSGPICHFGDVSISGNDHVADAIIHRQISFKQGDLFSRQEIDKSQEQIYSLNVFQVVSLQANLVESRKASIPVSIRIKEAPRFTNKFGVGWGQEDRFRTSMDTQWLRFLGGARRLNLLLKYSALEPYNINLRFTQPAFLSPTASFGLNPFIRRQYETSYDVHRRGLNVYLQRQIGRILTTGITYTYEKVKLDTTSIGAAKSQPNLTDLYNKSSVTLGVAQNSTDDIFSPSKGANNSLTFKYSGIGPSTYHYTKWMIDLRHYASLPRAVLGARLKVGEINSMDAGGFIPVEDRFYSGGANSIRGWARHELGPRDEDEKPIGGNTLLEASLEFRIPIIGSLASAIFWDGGNVWPGHFGDILNEFNHSVGLGLRFRTPIGPVRFDIAKPVYNDDKHIRWHLTLGEAF